MALPARDDAAEPAASPPGRQVSGDAADQSPLRHSLSGALHRGASFLLADDSEEESEREPLRRQGTVTENRERFQNNQRTAARGVLTRSAPLICVLLVVVAVWIGISIYFYTTGWIVWFRYSGKPCDKPLATWLLVTLLLPLVSCLAQAAAVSSPQCRLFRVVVQFSQLPVLIVGIVLFYQTETCAKTNPALYICVRNYLIFLSVNWALCVILPIIFVVVVIYLMMAGMFPGEGASPDVIKKMESITYDPSLFQEDGKIDDDKPAPACCICLVRYNEESSIKRTPCQHIFHEECLGKWLQNNTTCPLCREDVQDAVMGGGSTA